MDFIIHIKKIFDATDEYLDLLENLEKENFGDEGYSRATLKEMMDDKNLYKVQIQKRYNNIEESENKGLWDGSFVGYIIYRITDVYEICKIYIAPKFRGRHYADLFFMWLKNENKDKPIDEMQLEVRASNLVAINMYKRNKFKEIARRKDYYNNPTCDAVVMSCKYDREIDEKDTKKAKQGDV